MLNHTSWRIRYETALYVNVIVTVKELNPHKTFLRLKQEKRWVLNL